MVSFKDGLNNWESDLDGRLPRDCILQAPWGEDATVQITSATGSVQEGKELTLITYNNNAYAKALDVSIEAFKKSLDKNKGSYPKFSLHRSEGPGFMPTRGMVTRLDDPESSVFIGRSPEDGLLYVMERGTHRETYSGARNLEGRGGGWRLPNVAQFGMMASIENGSLLGNNLVRNFNGEAVSQMQLGRAYWVRYGTETRDNRRVGRFDGAGQISAKLVSSTGQEALRVAFTRCVKVYQQQSVSTATPAVPTPRPTPPRSGWRGLGRFPAGQPVATPYQGTPGLRRRGG